ncbi:C69 family dipeptidase, partial [Lactobacillus johnsonii]
MIESNHSACTSILIGKNATTDGSIIIGRNEDDKPNCAKHLAFHEEKDIPNN